MTLTPMQQKILDALPATMEKLLADFELSRRALYRHLTPMHEAKLIWYVNGGLVEKAGKVATWTSDEQPTTNS